VVGLVVKAPLADDEVGAGVLDPELSALITGVYPLLDHVQELLLLVHLELLVLLDTLNVELVLGLGAGRLKRTREDGNLGVLDLVGHLGVRKVLVDNDTVDNVRVLEGTTDLAVDLDELKVDVAALEVGNGKDGIDGNVGKLVVGNRDNLGAERGLGSLDEVGRVVLGEGDGVGDTVELSNSNLTRLLVTVGDTDGVDTAVEEGESRRKEGASED